VPGGITGPPVTGRHKHKRLGPGWRLDSRLVILLCEKIIVAKSKEIKTGCN
jgi:hypothetical protein